MGFFRIYLFSFIRAHHVQSYHLLSVSCINIFIWRATSGNERNLAANCKLHPQTHNAQRYISKTHIIVELRKRRPKQVGLIVEDLFMRFPLPSLRVCRVRIRWEQAVNINPYKNRINLMYLHSLPLNFREKRSTASVSLFLIANIFF